MYRVIFVVGAHFCDQTLGQLMLQTPQAPLKLNLLGAPGTEPTLRSSVDHIHRRVQSPVLSYVLISGARWIESAASLQYRLGPLVSSTPCLPNQESTCSNCARRQILVIGWGPGMMQDDSFMESDDAGPGSLSIADGSRWHHGACPSRSWCHNVTQSRHYD